VPAERVNAEEVGRRIERLRADCDPEVERETEAVDAGTFPELVDIARGGYLGGGYAWVVRRPGDQPPLSETMAESDRDERARALMLLPRGREKWGLPGGGIEGRETVEEAAVREVREETGVECALEDCWLVRRIRTVAEGRDPELHWLQAFFDAEYAGGRIEIQQGEANGAAWFAVPPTRMLPANERRAQRFF